MKNKTHEKSINKYVHDFVGHHPDIVDILITFINQYPMLGTLVPDILKVFSKIVSCFDAGNKLFICGNGGSFADSLHISGEMMKSFVKQRKLSGSDKKKFEGLPYGAELSDSLEYGFPVIVLGLNHSLYSAVENDIHKQYIGFAQELYALSKEGDVILGISTSGKAKNVIYAMIVAKAKHMTTIALTGEPGGELAQLVDLPIKVHHQSTNKIQELHLPVYHLICELVEAYYFKEKK